MLINDAESTLLEEKKEGGPCFFQQLFSKTYSRLHTENQICISV